MPTFISLINFTDQGIRNVKETPGRAEAFMAMAEKYGVKVQSVHYTVGRYDIVVIVEAPDDETATTVLLNAGSLGNIRSETLRGFTLDEMKGILAKMA